MTLITIKCNHGRSCAVKLMKVQQQKRLYYCELSAIVSTVSLNGRIQKGAGVQISCPWKNHKWLNSGTDTNREAVGSLSLKELFGSAPSRCFGDGPRMIVYTQDNLRQHPLDCYLSADSNTFPRELKQLTLNHKPLHVNVRALRAARL